MDISIGGPFVKRETDGHSPSHPPDLKATSSPIEDGKMDDGERSDEEILGNEFEEEFSAEISQFGMPYLPDKEPPPKLAAYHPAFVTVENLCAELFRDAAAILETSEYSDGNTTQILNTINRDQTIKYDPPSIIGIIGDSGVGKSSLINAVLDTPNLASAGGTGSAMTCVITEFHQAPSSQEIPFIGTVELFGRVQIHHMLQEHLQAYYEFHIEDLRELDEEEIYDRGIQARTAREVLVGLFADQEEFRNEAVAREFLGNMEGKIDQRILRHLYGWVDKILDRYEARNGLVYVAASSSEELSAKIEPWVTTNSSVQDGFYRSPSLWPIVRIARVSLKSLVLERGCIVSDLPGLSDINKVRTLTTQRYIRKCKSIFVVSSISRVQSDDAVHRRLNQAYKLLGPKRALVTTKIDEMVTTEKARNVGATVEEIGVHDRMTRAFAIVSAERTRLAKLRRSQKGKERQETDWKMADIMTKKQILQALIRRSLVNLRNRKVNAIVRDNYEAMTGDSSRLPILNVSNKDYELHRNGYDEEDIPLPLCDTGIPRLRRYLARLPANGKQTVLQHHWKGALTSVVDSLDSWSSQTAIHRRSDIRKAVEIPLKETESIIINLGTSLQRIFHETVIASIKNEVKVWEEHSIRLHAQWTELNVNSYMAFIRKNGTHKLKGGLPRDWNSELLEPVVRNLDKYWVDLEKIVCESRDDSLTRLVKLLDDIRINLGTIEGVSVLPTAPFLRSLLSKKEHLHRHLMAFSNKVISVCRDTKLNVNLEHEESFLMQEMLRMYEKLKCVTGNNLGVRRRTLLKDFLERGQPYAQILPGVQKAIEDGLHKYQAELLTDVQGVFQMVLADFDRMFVIEEVPDAKWEVTREHIKGFVKHARETLDGPIATQWAIATKGD